MGKLTRPTFPHMKTYVCRSGLPERMQYSIQTTPRKLRAIQILCIALLHGCYKSVLMIIKHIIIA